MQAFGSLFVGDAAKRKMSDAMAQSELDLTSGSVTVMSSSGQAAKGARMLRNAIQRGDDEGAVQAGARMLQGAWKSKVARRKVGSRRSFQSCALCITWI